MPRIHASQLRPAGQTQLGCKIQFMDDPVPPRRVTHRQGLHLCCINARPHHSLTLPRLRRLPFNRRGERVPVRLLETRWWLEAAWLTTATWRRHPRRMTARSHRIAIWQKLGGVVIDDSCATAQDIPFTLAKHASYSCPWITLASRHVDDTGLDSPCAFSPPSVAARSVTTTLSGAAASSFGSPRSKRS